jgi:hypothetical protein
MYTLLGNRGHIILSVADANIVQKQTQKSKGGMSDVYNEHGTYMKSFYTVMFSPQCVKVGTMGASNQRLHHNIEWNKCVPKILNERWKRQK